MVLNDRTFQSTFKLAQHRMSKIDLRSNGPRRLTAIYWTGPTRMFGTLIAGLLFALTHHFFYQYLNDLFVDDYFLNQAWVNNVATALAFLSKLMFVIASGVAYRQRQWFELGRCEHRIKHVDTITGVLEDVTLFFDIKTWLQRPVLLIMAIIAWSLPIAAIFTPGTLSVHPSEVGQGNYTQVPLISYANLNAYAQTADVSRYVAPSVELSRIALASSTSGQILQIPSQFQKESYSASFNGPALRCNVRQDQGVFAVVLREGMLEDAIQDVFDKRIFISFVPSNDWGILGTNVTAALYPEGTNNYMTLDVSSKDTARLYVMPGPLTHNLETAALIECQLYNATYNVNFGFSFPNQTITTRSVEYLNPVNGTMGYCSLGDYGTVPSCDVRRPHPYDHMAYQAIMDAFGSIIVGYEIASSSNFTTGMNTTWRTSRRLTSINWDSTETARQGLEELFRNITLSTMSVKSMTQQSSSDSRIVVTVWSPSNTYHYDSKFLFLSYGLSLLFSSICTLVGLHAMWLNQASYQNQFSSFIRAAWNRNPNIDVWIKEHDQGTEPLPRDVADARVRLYGDNSFNLINLRSSKTPLVSDMPHSSTDNGWVLPTLSLTAHESVHLRTSSETTDEESGPQER